MARKKGPTPTDPVLYKAILEKVKESVKRWPSAYASGMLVNQYKAAMAKLGREPYEETKNEGNQEHDLSRWFKEKWIDISTGKPCGAARSDAYYPTCRPSVRVTKETPVTSQELTKKEKNEMVAIKQVARKRLVMYDATQKVKR